MNKIQREQDCSKKYLLAEIKDSKNNGTLVKLTQDNVARVEAMIANDSDYLRGMDKNNNPDVDKNGGSTAYWMNELKKFLFTKNYQSHTYKEIIYGAVCAVDRENSTHLNADGVGREQITNRICRIPCDKFVKYLKEPDNTKLKIIDIIAKRTEPKDKIKHGRINTSFASKFCHYACLYVFEGEPNQDNFSIYDNILKKSIPRYAKYYGINCGDLGDYKNYRCVIDAILKKSGNKISRNGFDHLLWYYFKGRL